jgi:hypothetical protein
MANEVQVPVVIDNNAPRKYDPPRCKYIKPGFNRCCTKCGASLTSAGEVKAHRCGVPMACNEAKEHESQMQRDQLNKMTGNQKLIELRKIAKKLGIEGVNAKQEAQLEREIAEMRGEEVEKPAEPAVPKKEPSADEITALRDAIKAKGGKLPRGRKSKDPEALQAILDEMEDKED